MKKDYKYKEDNNSSKRNESIYYAPDNMKYVITNAPKLGILKSLGIIKNACVYKVMTHGLGGPVLLKVESSDIAIGKDIAEKILVRR
ncbi:MAG TPA: FeoA family protein [Defluviitaleaceae bacterium]|nr:ferrous iron transport protein A [Candidatus Epulonipiscium sp.]HOA79570.1 FeoA family protein [Defluviitaleaceae bacterium]